MKSFSEYHNPKIELELEKPKYSTDLLEAALTWGQLTAPDRKFRVDVFLKKYSSGDEFEMIDGSKKKFQYDAELYKAVKNRDKNKATEIGLTDLEGNKYTFGKLLKSKEFGGGTSGSGGGSGNTTTTESAQCVYAQCLWNNDKTEFSPQELTKAFTQVHVDGKLNDILEMSEDWKESSILGAKVLKRALGGKNYKWFRGVGFHVKMDDAYKKLNKVSGNYFSNVNKWSPADIWAVAESGQYKFDDAQTLTELNEKLLKAYNDRNVLGISLKKISGKAKMTSMNYRKPLPPIKFKKMTLGKRDFFKSKDGYIVYNDGEIQFRTFPEFQCEILGKSAKHGKVSQTQIRNILNIAGGKSFEERKQLFIDLNKDRDSFLQKFYYEYSNSKLTKSMPFNKFEEGLKGKNDEWLVSKYMVTQVFNNAVGKEQKFLDLLFRYAKSASPTSAVHLKVM